MSSYEVRNLISKLEDGKSDMDSRQTEDDREYRLEYEKNAYNALADALIYLLKRSDSDSN